jgi:hypothetical protein
VHEHGATEEAEEHVAQNSAVAGAVVGLLFGVVDVGGYDAVPEGFISTIKRRNLGCLDLHVSPADDYANHNTTLVHAFNVIGCPCQCVRNGGVNSSGTEEGSGVLDVDVVGPEKHSKANTAHEGHGHVAVSTPASAVGEPSDEDGHGCGYGVGRHGHELRFGVFVAHTEENGWLSKVLANLSMMRENKRGQNLPRTARKSTVGKDIPCSIERNPRSSSPCTQRRRTCGQMPLSQHELVHRRGDGGEHVCAHRESGNGRCQGNR